MSKQPILSAGVREEIIDCLEKSVTVENRWLREAILATPGLSESDVSAMHREDLVGEAVDLIEENFDGERFSIDSKGEFLVDLDKLLMERELVDQINDVKQYNDMIALAVITGENGSVSETISHLRVQEDSIADVMKEMINPNSELRKQEEPVAGLVSNPFSTPKGASVTINTKGVDIANAKGTHLDELKEGFKGVAEELPALRAKVLKAALNLGINKEAEKSSGLSFS